MNKFMNMDRVAFTLFGREIYWYGLIICFSIIVAVVVAMLLCKCRKYETDMPITIALIILPFGIASARLFAVLFDADLFISDYFNFSTGGMSIIGAIIGGGLALFGYCLIFKRSEMFKYFDTLAVVLILAQAIGRWGNFFNQEVYGQVIDSSSFFARFPFAVKIDDVYYQALFFYESILNLISFGFLAWIYLKQLKNGYVTGSYLVMYGVIRSCLEMFRQSDYILRLFGLPISLICSVLMIVLGVSILLYIKFKKVKLKGENNG